MHRQPARRPHVSTTASDRADSELEVQPGRGSAGAGKVIATVAAGGPQSGTPAQRRWGPNAPEIAGISGVDVVQTGGVCSRPVEQVARHVLQPEAVRHMVQNAVFYPRMAVALGTVSGRGVPTTR